MRSTADVEAFLNDLDTDQAGDLIDLVASLNPLEAKADGSPRWNAEQMNIIQLAQAFDERHPVEDVEEEADADVDEEGLATIDTIARIDEALSNPGERIKRERPAREGESIGSGYGA